MKKYIYPVILYLCWLAPSVAYAARWQNPYTTVLLATLLYFVLGCWIALASKESHVTHNRVRTIYTWPAQVFPLTMTQWMWLHGHKPIRGRDWGYADERESKIIGYEMRSGVITIIDKRTWEETTP